MASSSTSALLRRVGTALARAAISRASKTRRETATSSRSKSVPSPSARGQEQAYRGDFTGRATISYAPRADGDADPGEVA